MDSIPTKNMAAPLSPTSVSSSTTSSRKFRRDTGFPEPFCGTRNTTLPHPDADLSPDASISADDIDTERTIQRSHRSILRRNKHKGTLKYGKITAEGGDDPFRHASVSSSSLNGTGRESGDDVTTPAALEEISVVMLPNGKISTDGMLSFEEERARQEEEEEEEHKKKRRLFRRILGYSR